MDQVEDKVLEITDEDFPAFLYENGTVYDEKNEDLGLFRGYLLVRVSTSNEFHIQMHLWCSMSGLSIHFHRTIIGDGSRWKGGKQDESKTIQTIWGDRTHHCIHLCSSTYNLKFYFNYLIWLYRHTLLCRLWANGALMMISSIFKTFTRQSLWCLNRIQTIHG